MKSLNSLIPTEDCQDIKSLGMTEKLIFEILSLILILFILIFILILVQQQLLNLLSEMQTIINQRKEQQEQQQIDQNNTQKRIGIVIYSLSEIILCLGEAWTFRWLYQLNQIILSPPPLSSSSSTSNPITTSLYKTKTEPFLSILLLLHSSLHLSSFVSKLQVSIISIVYYLFLSNNSSHFRL